MSIDLSEILKDHLVSQGHTEAEAERITTEIFKNDETRPPDEVRTRILESLKSNYPDVSEEKLSKAVDVDENGSWSIDGTAFPAKTLQQKLLDWKEWGHEAVEIMAYRVDGICNVCQGDCFEHYTIEEAIEREILPHDDCSCVGEAAREDQDPPCDCTYMPAFLNQVPESRR